MQRPARATPLSAPARGGARVYSVRQVLAEARVVVEWRFGRVRIQGELSNLRPAASGHWYFTLKDAAASLRCAMFASRNRFVRFRPRDGDAVVVSGRLSIYEGRGDFQAVIDHIEQAGEGALRAAYERLKAKLDAEGLFAAAAKRPLPPFPRHIAVVSSRAGAALSDVLSVLRRRLPSVRVTCFDVAVQGVEAPAQIRLAMERAERARHRPDLIIVTRGGGSLEDLAPFNAESVVRRIAACRVPVVSAVGHETDFTLCDLVADQRAPTPSAAAEMATPDTAELLAVIARLQRSLRTRVAAKLAVEHRVLDAAKRRLAHPQRVLEQRVLKADELRERLGAALAAQLASRATAIHHQARLLARSTPARSLAIHRERLRELRGRLLGATEARGQRAATALSGLALALGAVSPLATLKRGFAIVARPDGSRWGRPLASAREAAAGDAIVAHLADGRLLARVEGAVIAPGRESPPPESDHAPAGGPRA